MLVNIPALAQQFPLSSQYVINPYSLTPTLAGSTGFPEVFLGYRKDMAGINGAPRTINVNGAGNIMGNNMWVGGEIYSDKTDILSLFKAQLSYTYRLQVQNDQFLSFSAWGAFYQNSVNVDNAIGIDPNDPLINNASKLNTSAFNAGFGLNYNWRDFNFGVSFPTLFSNKEEYSLNPGFYLRMQREILVYGSNLFQLHNDWKLQTYVVYRKMNYEPANFDISLMAIYIDRFWFGTLYRNSGAISVNLGGLIYKGFTFNYSYDIGAGGINSKSGGAHEISLGYRFNFDGNNYFDKKSSGGKKRGKSRRSRELPFPQVQEYDFNRR